MSIQPKNWTLDYPTRPPQQRAESSSSAHALVAKAVVQLDTVLTTLSSANHAASPEGRLIITDLIRMAGALRSRAIELEDAMAKMGKRT